MGQFALKVYEGGCEDGSWKKKKFQKKKKFFTKMTISQSFLNQN